MTRALSTEGDYQVLRHSGRRGAEWRVAFKGDWQTAFRQYESIALDLRQGAVRFICSCGDVIKSTSAPRLRTRW